MTPLQPTTIFVLTIALVAGNPAAVTYHLYYYILTVIEQLASTDSGGVFTCVFYDKHPNNPEDNILELIMASPRLSYIPRFCIDGSLPHVRYGLWPDNPSLILYRAGNSHWSFDEQMFHTLDLFHPNTRMLVFVDCTRAEYFEANSAVIVEELRYNKVVYLCTTQFTVARTELNWGLVTELSHYPEAGDLFRDVVRDLRGLPITYTWRNIDEYDEEDSALDPSAMWIKESAKYLNGSGKLIMCPCKFEKKLFDACYKNFLKSDKIEFSIDGMKANEHIPGNVRLIYSNVPSSDRLFIPMGRPLNVVELFFVPFTCSMWILLVLLLTVAELISMLKPSLFRNDPIMIVICSFERYNLHQAGRFEKFVLQSLIVTFFFLSNAYETKIIALMTAKPSYRVPKTLQDLVELKIPIKADLRKDPNLINNTQLGHLVEHSIVSFLDLDGTSAYKADENWLKFIEAIPYIGIFHRERRYRQLRQILGIHVWGFYTSYRSPFIKQFRRTHQIFEESGIESHWKTNVVLLAWRHPLLSNKNIVPAGVQPYQLDDLTMAWAALMAGFGAALVMFISEVAVNFCLVLIGRIFVRKK